MKARSMEDATRKYKTMQCNEMNENYVMFIIVYLFYANFIAKYILVFGLVLS